MLPGTYVSADALERAEAYELGYRDVCTAPSEIGSLDVHETLVLDFNYVLFDDQETAIVMVNKHARRGVLVGLHTYYPQALQAYPLASPPYVIVAKTHRELLVLLDQYARLHGRPWQTVAQMVPSLESEVQLVPDKDQEIHAGDPVVA